MNKLFLLSIFILSIIGTNLSFSQTSDNTLKFENEGKYLTNIKGWFLNTQKEKWICNDNMIFKEEKKTKLSSVTNADSITIRKVIYKEIPYYVLLIYKESGFYKNAAFELDWKSENALKYIVFSKKDYLLFKDVFSQDNPEPRFINYYITAELTSGSEPITERLILDDLEQKLKEIYNKSIVYKDKWDKKRALRARYKKDFYAYLCKEDKSVIKYFFPISSQIKYGKEIVRFLFSVCESDLAFALKSNHFEVIKADFMKILID